MTTEINEIEKENGRTQVAFIGEVKEALTEIAKEFGYPTLSLAARNAVIVGYGEFKDDPKAFIQKLNNSKLN